MWRRRPFAPGDVVHVPDDHYGTYDRFVYTSPTLTQTYRVQGFNIKCIDARFNSTAVLVHIDHDKAYVMTSEGTMGWIGLTCCVRRLDEERTTLLHEVSHVKIINDMRTNWQGFEWFGLGLITLVFVALIGGLVVAGKALASNGRVDHCYVSWQEPMTGSPRTVAGEYVIYGHVSWRNDRMLGSAPTAQEAHELALNICPVK